MSKKPSLRVSVEADGQVSAPYRTMRDASPELQREYGALLESTRRKVAGVTNVASVAGGILLADAVLNWEPSIARYLGMLFTTSLIVAPQVIKHINKQDLALLREYQETVSVHVDNDLNQVNRTVDRKQLRVLANLNEADHGSTKEVEAGVGLFIAVLRFLSFWDTMKNSGGEFEVLCAALVTALLALAATVLTRKALSDEQKRFRGEMKTFLRRIPGNTRVSYDVAVGEDHTVEVNARPQKKEVK